MLPLAPLQCAQARAQPLYPSGWDLHSVLKFISVFTVLSRGILVLVLHMYAHDNWCWPSQECLLGNSGAVIRCSVAAVMKHGQVVEQGSHAELMRRPGGAYAALIKLQAAARRGDNQVCIIHAL